MTKPMDKIRLIYEEKSIELSQTEAKEVFTIFRNIVDDAHYAHRPKKEWPLYDRLADFLGENTLAQHNEALTLRDEEEEVDEWRASLGRD